MTRPIHLFFDFDDTITLHSTISILGNINLSPTTPFQELTSLYLKDFQNHKNNYAPHPSHRRTVSAELSFLNSLESVEARSIGRIENAGIFKNVTEEMIRNVVKEKREQIGVRKGFKELVKSVIERGGNVDVLSVNWIVTKSLNPQGLEIYKIGYTHGIDSEWNETDSGIWTTGDKLSVMNQVLELSWKAAHKEGRNPRVVYIGDSMTDLAALIAADIGVCIRDGNGEIESQVGEKKVLGETLERVGVGVEWAERIKELVGDGEVGSREGEGEKMLYWAKDFDEVREALFER